MPEHLIPRSMLTLQFGREVRLADSGYDLGRSFEHHYQRALPKLHEIGESLILSPTVTVGIVGANIQLPFLAEYFGVGPLTDLLSQGGLEFKQITESVALATNDDGTAYLSPEPAVRGPENADPLAAAEIGLLRYGSWIPEEDRRVLVRKAADRTASPPAGIASDVIAVTLDRIPEGAAAFALKATRADAAAVEAIRRRCLDWATSLSRSMMVYDDSYALMNEDDPWAFAYQAAETCVRHTGISELSESVLARENMLSIAELLRRGKLAPEDIVSLRGKSATDVFRQWLWSEATDGRDAAADWLKVGTIDLEEGWLRWASVIGLAIGKAFGAFELKKKLGVADELAQGAAEAATDVVVDSVFYRVAKWVRERSPRNFVPELVNMAGRRAVRRNG